MHERSASVPARPYTGEDRVAEVDQDHAGVGNPGGRRAYVGIGGRGVRGAVLHLPEFTALVLAVATEGVVRAHRTR